MIDFKASANKQTSESSSIMEGKQKMSMADLIRLYPNGVTVYKAELIGRGEDKYPVILFTENPDVFAFGGTALRGIVSDWLDQYNGDADAMNRELQLFGGVRMKFEKATTRNGRPFTRVTVL